MNNLIPLTLLLVLSVVYVASQKQQNKLMVALVVVSVVLFFCMMDMREKFSNYAATNHKMGVCSGIDLTKQPSGSLVRGYDALSIKQKKDDHKLLSDVSISTPTGDEVKLQSDMMSDSFPTVDGGESSPKHMFILARNQCRPGCCPSTYSCSTGCVCTSNKQRKYINTRGGNRTLKTAQEM